MDVYSDDINADSEQTTKKRRIETAGASEIPPPKQRLNLKPGAVVDFECTPSHKTAEAIRHAVQLPGVKNATDGCKDGLVAILIDPEARFKKYSDCFDGQDWKMYKLPKSSGVTFAMSTSPAALPETCSIPQKHGSDELWVNRLKGIVLTDDERANLPVIGFLLGTHGRNMIAHGERPQKDTFMCFGLVEGPPVHAYIQTNWFFFCSHKEGNLNIY
jgi:hypothetical protein